MRNKKRFQLRFLGIDYKARVFINQQDLCEITGMFIQHEFDVTDFINRDGENFIAVVFEPMPKASPNHVSLIDQQPADFAKYHRSQMSWGWDWMRGMVTAGIWDHVYISGNDEARISDCFFQWSGGRVCLAVDSVAQKTDIFDLKITLAPKNSKGKTLRFTEKIALQHGENHTEITFDYPNPELWYPNGYGKQPLYNLTLEIAGEVTEKTVAFRILEMRRNPNSADQSYNHTFTFNGVEIFARGANWTPADLMHSRSTKEDYERLVRLAAESGTNIFRVWGGGIIEKEYFYNACDRYGIIVWQEFMHACSNYCKDAEYVAFKRIEGEAILRKIRNHVSVSLICGGNEMLYYGEIPNSPVYVQYEELVKKFTPQLPFHATSPNLSIPGERHHGPWSFSIHSEMNKHNRQFVSEIGCNSFCEYENIPKFIPENEIENPNSQSWKYHFSAPCRVFDWKIPQQYFAAENTAQRCQVSMFAQSDMLGYWMNHCRRKYPATSGCIFWQYNEPWPTLAWSYIDYYTMPKMAYYRLARVQKNTVLSLRDRHWCCTDGKFCAELFLTSDIAVKNIKAVFKLVSFDGKILLDRKYSGNFQKETCKLDTLEFPLPDCLPGNIVLAQLVLEQDNEIIFRDTLVYGVPNFNEVFKLPNPELKVSASCKKNNRETLLRIELENLGNNSALLVKAVLSNISFKNVYFMDNYVTLTAGEKRTIEAKIVDRPSNIKKLKISGWNLKEIEISIGKDNFKKI